MAQVQSVATSTNPSTPGLRSGDLVNASMTTTGMAGALLAPWIEGLLKFVTDHAHGYLAFGEGYSMQLTVGLIVGAVAFQGRMHMRSIRKQDAQPPVHDPADQLG